MNSLLKMTKSIMNEKSYMFIIQNKAKEKAELMEQEMRKCGLNFI